ncbi:hypothetical protein JHD47_06635 [Sulfurimonas sp. SAG-AH-194-L11]|nr:hypothetical protein [Sulfurimonas sp. SAG-AH-194-L11]MDF1877490.1 hypothetical protein [Sulfurimonas sp. SAG-AH-194-L11]
MKVFIFLLISTTLLFSSIDTKLKKDLSSANRASTQLENLIDAGDLEAAEKFEKLVNAKYTNNADILCWTGKLYFEKKDLELAKIYFRSALDIDPTHEISKMQLELIQEQEDAHENKDVETLLELLSDKGLDFLLIFLGFLGAEIISKRYASCQKNSVFTRANHFIQRHELVKSFRKRILFSFRYLKPRKFSLVCPLIDLLVLITMSFAILVPFLFVEFYYELTIFTNEPYITMSSEYIEAHFWLVFTCLVSLTFLVFSLGNSLRLTSDKYMYEIELVEELDRLLANAEYSDLHNVLHYLNKRGISQIEIETLLQKYSSDAEGILKFSTDISARL